MEIIDLFSTDCAEGWQPEPGKCYSNLPNEIYHGLKDWNGSSMLKHGLRSVESYKYEKKQPHKRTLPFERGSALHVAMEGLIIGDDWEMFEREVRSFDGKQIPSKKFNEVAESNPGCYVIPEKTKENVKIMAAKAKKKADILNIFNNGYSELSFFWIDEETGIQCKVRPDYFRPDIGSIVDYKTTKNHTEDGFPREIVNYGYHFSAAFYIEGVEKVAGIEIENEMFIIIAIANTAPFEIEFFPLKHGALEQGSFLFKKVMSDIKNFDTKPVFKPLEIPLWAMTYIDEEY